jgi:hypothetical protein
MEVPMLDEGEFNEIDRLYRECIRNAKEKRERGKLSLEGINHDWLFDPVRVAYYEITGFAETNHNAIVHHRIALYGKPCSNCEKPLRTPQARFCAACGAPRSNE